TLDREKFTDAKETLKGGYILSDDDKSEIMIIASGSEVPLAIEVGEMLREAGRKIRIVSMPSLDVYNKQSEGYHKRIMPKRIKKRVVIEAGVIQGWEGILGDGGIFIGMDDFGHSGPAESLAVKFGFCVDKILDKLAEADY
ncbi:MAG: transketolase, partial [Planctomycetes bacterium]|nr:transketolase [Planctomycetota bacterium]